MTLTTKISQAGSVEIPESVREANGWTAGMELEIIERGMELILRPRLSRREKLFPLITIEEFFEKVPRYDGPPVSDEMMNEAVLKEAKRRWHAQGG